MKCKSRRALQPQISKTLNWATLLIGNNIYDMKKLLNLLCLFAVLASSCSREELLVDEAATSLNDIIFTAGFEQDTRTYIQDGTFLRWNEGDQISIFVANTLNRQYKFDGETGDNGGTFSVVDAPFGTGNDLACHYAVYPYAAGVKITEKGVVTTALPAEQSYAENSFGLGANTMVAVTKDTDDTFLKFKNVCGYLMLQLYGNNITVKSITLTGNNDEKLAGKATVTPLYGQEPTIAMSDDATTSITLNCGDGVKLGASAETATAFWIVVPPTTFDEGFEITVTDVNGNTFTKTTSKEVAIERNVIKPMAAFEVEIDIIPNNQIWYTRSSAFNSYELEDITTVDIISHTFEDGKGIITYDKDITNISEEAFYGTGITSIILPNSINKIGSYAFQDCWLLKSVILPNNITRIPLCAFDGCTNLTDVIIPNSVTSIGESAFGNCSSLTNIIIPDAVTDIGMEAFYDCNSITSITIPKSVTTIRMYAFAQCKSLKSVYCKSTTPPTPPYDGSYWGILSSTEAKIYVPASDDNSVIIAYKVATLWNPYADYIFEYDYENNEVVLEEPLQMSNIYYTATAKVQPRIAYIFSNEWDQTTGNGVITLFGEVTTIGEGAFSNCSKLTSITIPNTVTTIGSDAFNHCTSLTSVNIPDGVTKIEIDAFCYCSSLTSITIPDSVTSIGDGAFYQCYSLTSVTISNGVTTIGDSAFDRCTSLTSVTIPNSVTSIGQSAFDNCTNLTSVYCKPTTPPTGGNYMFNGNASGRKIYVPATSVEAYKSANYWSGYADAIVGYDF